MSSGVNRRSWAVTNPDDGDFDPNQSFKDHHSPRFALKDNSFSFTKAVRTLSSFTGRKLNFQNLLILSLLLGVFYVYSSIKSVERILNSLQDEPTGSSSSCSNNNRFALHGPHLDTSKISTPSYLKHVSEVLNTISYKQVPFSTDNWTLLWSHDYPFSKHKAKLLSILQSSPANSLFPKVNHFPGSGHITNKVHLATTKPHQPFIPRAFLLPQEKAEFLTHAKENPHKRFVLKSSNHRGIRIIKFDSFHENFPNNTFLQEYVSNPLLIDGHKFDIGVYTVLTSLTPLRIYIYFGDVLFRFCPEKYHPFDSDDEDKYVVGDDYLPIWKLPSLQDYYSKGFGMKDTFNLYYKSVLKKNPEDVWEKVKEAIRKVYLLKIEKLRKTLHSFGESNYNSHFFEMVRFDFVIDEDGKVHLMEANMSPNLSSAHFPENALLYRQVLYNVFNLVGIRGRDLSDNAQVSRKQLSVDKCGAVECGLGSDCDNLCDLLACRETCGEKSSEAETALKSAYLEEMNKGDCVRVWPLAKDSKDELDHELGWMDRVQTEWIRSKCSNGELRFC